MTQFFSTPWTPWYTPFCIAVLLIVTATLSIAVAFIDAMTASFAPSFSLSWWLALSDWGWSHYYLWQPFTYLLVYPTDGQLSISYLFELAFLLYCLWLMSAEISERISAKTFLIFYFLTGAIAGLVAVAILPGYGMLLGPAASVLATLTLWTMLGPYDEIFLFFLLPIERRWIFSCIAASFLLVLTAQAHWVKLMCYLCGILGGYLYGTISWQLMGPTACTGKLDRMLYQLSGRLSAFWKHLTKSSQKPSSTAKIFDFHTGQLIMDDDTFIDTMLAKISRQGEESLTRNERKRMEEISAKKKKQL